MGTEAGYCRGRGGSMHIADVEGGNLGANSIVAGGLPLSADHRLIDGAIAARFLRDLVAGLERPERLLW